MMWSATRTSSRTAQKALHDLLPPSRAAVLPAQPSRSSIALIPGVHQQHRQFHNQPRLSHQSNPQKTTPTIQNLTTSNQKYASQFTQGDLEGPPAKKYLILTCMDARIDPVAAFGIELGDAHVIRNAGAWARDALRSIIISQQMLGTREILLIKHTNCGMVTFTNDEAYKIIEKNLGTGATKELKETNMDFGPFPDLDQAVKEDVAFLKGTKTISEDVEISGWVYEVETGKVRRVV